MTTAAQTWTEEIVEVAGTSIQLVKGGRGDPLLVLHDEMGHPGWLRFHEALAQHHTLVIPSHPGYGESKRLDWVMNMRDLAGWYLQALEELGLDRIDVVGLSLGGWLAAEIASMCPHRFSKLVLVNAPGVRPPTGEIFDMFLVTATEFLTASYLDPANTPEFQRVCPDEPTAEQVETWEVAREESCRLTWKPYMHYPALPHLLRGIKRVPTLVIWGRENPIVPLSAADIYHEAIDGSRLEVIDNCGHHPEVEKPDEFVHLVREFLAG